MDIGFFKEIWAPKAGKQLGFAYAIGANAAVQIRAPANDGGSPARVTPQFPIYIAVKVISTSGYAHLALGDSAVALPADTTDIPVTPSDGWVRMILHSQDTHLRAFGVTGAGTIHVWFQGKD